MNRVTRVEALDKYRLDLTFDDGTRGIVDLSHLVGRGVFSLWNDPDEFQQVRIGQAGELVWQDQLDLCADSLYLKLTGKMPEDVFPNLRHQPTHA